VFYGMIASTCLAVLFVPSFYVVMQRIEEWRMSRKAKTAQPATKEAVILREKPLGPAR